MPKFSITVEARASFTYELEAADFDAAKDEAIGMADKEPSLVKGHEADGTEFSLDVLDDSEEISEDD